MLFAVADALLPTGLLSASLSTPSAPPFSDPSPVFSSIFLTGCPGAASILHSYFSQTYKCKISQLPYEPANFYNHNGVVDIPIDSAAVHLDIPIDYDFYPPDHMI
ncbi:hypothetical protein L1887_17820 [Cichorium endivia]|nr:hypothetical protein L1887_17820 [Cichorium endivia]